MSTPRFPLPLASACLLAGAFALAPAAHADPVTEANARAAEIASANAPTPVGVRTMALVQVSVHDAVQSITGRYRPILGTGRSPRGASVEAAVAAATRSVLLALAPAQRPAIEADYEGALARVPAGAGRSDGIAAGERAAAAVLAARADDGAQAPNGYRPRTTPGVYVPTTLPAVPHWGRRKPWLLSAGDQLRPEPPPALDSEIWRRDLAESAEMGRRNSTARTAEQTAIARFWETTSPAIYWPVVRSAATGDLSDNACLLAQAGMAMDDAVIAVFDAKYAHELWRPITAIRNTPELQDPAWEPLVETPMHPEFPCAHCIVSSAVGTVIEGKIGNGKSPVLRTTSPTAGGAERTWASPAEFVREVSEARICAGVHYRNSTEVGQAMGRKIGALAGRRMQVAAR